MKLNQLRYFVAKYPKFELNLLHGSFDQICKLVASGEAGIALITQPAGVFPDLLMLEYRPMVLVVRGQDAALFAGLRDA
jgi:hypothetical protein